MISDEPTEVGQRPACVLDREGDLRRTENRLEHCVTEAQGSLSSAREPGSRRLEHSWSIASLLLAASHR